MIFKLSLNQKTSQEMTEGVTKAPNYISQCSVNLCWICQVQCSLPIAETVSLHMLGGLCLQNKKASRIGKTSYMASNNPRPPSCCFTIQLFVWKLARQIKDPVCVHVCSVAQLCPILCNPMLQFTRLFCPWDSPGKNTGMGCHFPKPRIEPTFPVSPALQADSLPWSCWESLSPVVFVNVFMKHGNYISTR